MVILPNYPNIVPYESSRKIIEQMEKAICQIKRLIILLNKHLNL